MSSFDAPFVGDLSSEELFAKKGYRQRGGQIILEPTLPSTNTTFPNAFQLLLEYESVRAIPCELEIQMQYQEPSILASGFPDATFSIGYCAGARIDAVNAWDDSDQPVIVKYETGAGPDARTFYSDLRPGRVSLGAQTRVRVSIARWLVADVGGANVAIQGSIAPSQGTDADPPTYSATAIIPAGATRTITAPPGAFWFDFFAQQSGSIVSATGFRAFFYKDFSLAAPIQIPYVMPAPWPSGESLLSVANLGAAEAWVTVCWWVR